MHHQDILNLHLCQLYGPLVRQIYCNNMTIYNIFTHVCIWIIFEISVDASKRPLNTGNVIFTKLEFNIRRTLSCNVSKSSSLDLMGSISDALRIISVEPTSSANACCVEFGLYQSLSDQTNFANLLANSGKVVSASSLY